MHACPMGHWTCTKVPLQATPHGHMQHVTHCTCHHYHMPSDPAQPYLSACSLCNEYSLLCSQDACKHSQEYSKCDDLKKFCRSHGDLRCTHHTMLGAAYAHTCHVHNLANTPHACFHDQDNKGTTLDTHHHHTNSAPTWRTPSWAQGGVGNHHEKHHEHRAVHAVSQKTCASHTDQPGCTATTKSAPSHHCCPQCPPLQ